MGRHRQPDSDPYHPLPKGLYEHRKRFRARDPKGAGRWKSFEGPRKAAIAAYDTWRVNHQDVDPNYKGSVAWLIDDFTLNVVPQRVKGQQLAPRTAKDYLSDGKIVKKGLGLIPVDKLQPFHIARFRDALITKAPVHARHVIACLSAAMSYAVLAKLRDDNPCRQLRWPRTRKRARLITDDEYLKVYARAVPSVQLAMFLAVRTLALPADVLRMGTHNIRMAAGKRILSFRRGKTNALVEIELTGELGEVIERCLEDPMVRFHKLPFVHTESTIGLDGKITATAYTRDGIASMFRRYCVGTKELPLAESDAVADFGLRDLRAKGATDMYRAGVDVRQVQQLLGHSSETMTRTYLKGYITEIVKPNMVPIIGRVK